MFICVCLPVVLIQSNFNTPGDRSRSDTNKFSRGVQPIFRDICFSCSRAITMHQVIAIFLQFHFLSWYRDDYFLLQLIDQITFLLSSCKCVTLIMLCVRPLSLYIAIPTTKPVVNALAQALPCLHDDFSGIKYYCVRSCENECMYSWWVFNNEIIYYRHL